MRIRLLSLLVLFLCAELGLFAQADTIYLNNPSFEDIPRHSKPPRGWIDCGFEGETPVDVHPGTEFGVTKRAIHGSTYLGMVVRDNDTWERVAQPLSSPMEAGYCYTFSLYLARSDTYVSVSQLKDKPANYNTSAKLRIYGASSNCKKEMLLAETNLIIHPRWIQYQFKFEPKANYSHIMFEAFFNTPTLFPYNGNILLDNASNIVRIPCDENELIVEDEEEEDPEEKTPPAVVTQDPPAQQKPPVTPPPATPNPNNNVVQNTTPTPPKTPEPKAQPKELIESTDLSEIKREELKAGTIIRTNQIYFASDSYEITDQSFETLDQLMKFLQQNRDVSIEIGGHTNGLCDSDYCNELSTNRARSVVQYLVRKGIGGNRLKYKGYGKRMRISSDATLGGRKKNQRVEIKILSLGSR